MGIIIDARRGEEIFISMKSINEKDADEDERVGREIIAGTARESVKL
jgi:hypothetical protein